MMKYRDYIYIIRCWVSTSVWKANEVLDSAKLFGQMREKRNQGEIEILVFASQNITTNPSRFINCKMLGLKNHKNAPTSDDWLLDD